MEQKYRNKIEHIQKTLHTLWKREVAHPEGLIDENVKHIFREHHLANLGAERQRKITVEKGDNTENWKAVRGFWDGSKKTDGKSGCGVVIKEMWTRTIGSQSVQIAVPLSVCGSQCFY